MSEQNKKGRIPERDELNIKYGPWTELGAWEKKPDLLLFTPCRPSVDTQKLTEEKKRKPRVVKGKKAKPSS